MTHIHAIGHEFVSFLASWSSALESRQLVTLGIEATYAWCTQANSLPLADACSQHGLLKLPVGLALLILGLLQLPDELLLELFQLLCLAFVLVDQSLFAFGLFLVFIFELVPLSILKILDVLAGRRNLLLDGV